MSSSPPTSHGSTTYTAASTYTADSMARKYGITVDQLQAMNPGHNIRAGIVKGVTINVPTTYGLGPDAGGGTTTPSSEFPTPAGEPDPPGHGTNTTPGTATGVPSAPMDNKTATQNAADALSNLFQQYGLGSLSGRIVEMAQQGLGADSIILQLQQTPEYKARFAANDTRISKGMNALTPAEYIATESAYRRIMASSGLPTGFYDQQGDFTNFIANDMSPTELQDRVSAATEAINQAPSDTLKYASQWYGIGDLVAYALDPNKAATLVEQRLKAAEAGGLAARNKTSVSQGLAEQIGAENLSYGQMQQGFGDVGQMAPTASKLAALYDKSVTSDDLVKEVFLNDANATKKVKGLASQERAMFGGTSGQGRGSMSTDGGQF